MSLASFGQETPEGVGVTALKSIKLREALKHCFLFFFRRGGKEGGSALNTGLVGKRHCTTTALMASVFNVKL